ncbi:MAG: TolC family protein [Prevotella sp.]|nr:TolC family protein [Prevotella sp.]
MTNRRKLLTFLLLIFAVSAFGQTSGVKKWSLQECIDYALQNNIQLKKSSVQRRSAQEDVLQSRADLLPSLSASTNQSLTYRPFVSSGQSTVANGYVQSSVDKVYYNGTYGVNANWTVWNGNRNKNTIRLNELSVQQAEVDSITTARSIEEKIVQLYVQILYTTEAIKVSQQSLETSKLNEQRGKVMVDVGKMSKADLAQLTAQRAQDEYSIVAAESNVKNYLFQLKQLLELTDAADFDIEIPSYTDAQALEEIPALNAVYAQALERRPEIQAAKLAIESSNVNMEIARAGKSPTVGVSGSFGTNTTSMSDKGLGNQLKSNLDLAVGATLSIPIFDNRQTKTAINKARLQRESSMLDLQDKQKTLYNTIEGYWIDANTNQSKYKAARIATQSQLTSYELLSEQFRLGLKNIIELMTGKTNLVQAQQNELESKYMTILDIYMLKYYQR